MPVEVGVREFRGRLRHWLDRVASGEEVIVTERGRARARLTPVDRPTTRERLIAQGIVTPARRPKASTRLPKRRIKIKGDIDDIVRDAKGRY